MNSYPVFERDLELALKEDQDGNFLHEYQDALREFRDAVENHLSRGQDKDDFSRWNELLTAADAAGDAVAKIRNHLLLT